MQQHWTILPGALAAAVLANGAVQAQTAADWPLKPVKLVVAQATGGGTDIQARLFATRLSENMGRQFLVENRVGAGGRIAAEFVAKSPADGYTLMLGTASTHMIIPNVSKVQTYDPFKDFTPVTILITPATSVVITASLPMRNMQDLVAYGKANPGKLAYGSNGVATSAHLIGELLKMAGNFDMLHVPYKGSNEAMAALLAETIQVYFSSPGPTRPHVQAGKMRLLGVLSPKRFSGTPDVPTVAESLPGFEPITDWFAIFGPGGTPTPIVNRLNSEFVKALNQPEVRAEFEIGRAHV